MTAADPQQHVDALYAVAGLMDDAGKPNTQAAIEAAAQYLIDLQTEADALAAALAEIAHGNRTKAGLKQLARAALHLD